ncbi:MAG: hypothetical protein IT267_11715 [Saprospiraceae bacterium]|nr:hypothetical protein [Saprospiraceae bacterium]
MKQEKEIQEIEILEKEAQEAIFKGKKNKVIQLYQKIETIFSKGDNHTKAIISNTFVLPLTHLLEMNYSWGIDYLQLLPIQLKAEYYRQIYSSGI